jgi:hypothetical protein
LKVANIYKKLLQWCCSSFSYTIIKPVPSAGKTENKWLLIILDFCLIPFSLVYIPIFKGAVDETKQGVKMGVVLGSHYFKDLNL